MPIARASSAHREFDRPGSRPIRSFSATPNPLFAAEVALHRLDRDMAQKELDLVQSATCRGGMGRCSVNGGTG